MSQEAGNLRPVAEWQPLDRQSLLEALDLFRRTTELERMDEDPDPERLALEDWREELSHGMMFCRYCLLAIAVLLAIIAVRM